MQLFQGFLSRGSGRRASHELWPGSLPLQEAGAGTSESAERGGGGEWLPPALRHHGRPRRGSGHRLSALPDIWPRRPLREALLRPPPLSPPLAPRRRQAPPDARPAPRPWKFPRRPGTVTLRRASPPRPRGPALPTPPGEEKNSLSSVNLRRAAAFRCAPDFAGKRPGIGGNQGFPRLPHSQNCLLRPVPIRDARLERAPLSRPCSLGMEASNKNTSPCIYIYIYP